MDFQGTHQPESGKLEQILSQFLLKSLHIILDSRIPSLRSRDRSGDSSPLPVKKSDKWFNLVLSDRPAALDNLTFWHRNVLDPMFIDIILVQEDRETLLERWTVQYEAPRGVTAERFQSYKRTYKKAIVLLRSLYSHLRLLPAYRIFRRLCSVSQSFNFDIIYRVSSLCHPAKNEKTLQEYCFAPVEAPPGRFSVSVSYFPNLSDFNLQALTIFPPKIIPDYVGSPTTDPLRSFPSEKAVRATSFPSRGFPNEGNSPWHRPHSWSSGFQRDSFSPPSDGFPYKSKASPTISDPKFTPKSVQNRPLFETAPVSIPLPLGRSLRYISPNFSDLNRSSLPPLSPRSTRHDSSSQESPSSIRYIRKPEGAMHAPRDSREDSGRFSGLLSSSGSPRVGVSRSSSRLSLQDDLDECDFSCPFIVDDVDVADRSGTHELAESMGKKSQDAAVGMLVHMLRNAPPLRQDSSCYSARSVRSERKGETEGDDEDVGGFFMPRKASDALEELKGYKELKELLLSRSGNRIVAKEEDR